MKKPTIYAGLLIGVASLVALPLPSSGQETAQNLSVPAILVGPLGSLVCGASIGDPSLLKRPTGTPLTDYEVSGYYWVQKVHTWQAQCFNDVRALVFGNWGDNLSGSASLRVGSPIRVELVLTNMGDYSPTSTLQGYEVIKLEPSKLDRESAYGHTAGSPETGFTDFPSDVGSAQWVVHDAGITFSVLNLDTGVYAVPENTRPTAEINATGKIVYGYNLRVGTAGTYQIHFTTSDNVMFTGADAGEELELNDANNVYLNIVVAPGGSGGGGGGSGGGGGPGGR